MTFDEIKYDYSNKAQTKIAELTDVIQVQLAQGNEAEDALTSSIELLNFQESLLCSLNPWSESDTLYWIEYFKTKYALFDTPYVNTDIFDIPITLPGNNNGGGDFATVADLADLRADMNAVDSALSDRITALEEFDYSGIIPQSLLADVGQLKTTSEEHQESIASLIEDLEAVITALNQHIADNVKHITSAERTSWNARVTASQLSTAIAGLAAAGHSHLIGDIGGLSGILSSLQTQINNIPTPQNGENGQTPTIQIGTVTEGDEFSVTLDPASTQLLVILNFVLVRGEKGDGFIIDAIGLLADRGNHDDEEEGFAFLAQDTGLLYFLVEPSVWSTGVQFTGYNGWTPRIALYEFNADTVLLEILGFTGGTGPEPQLVAPVGAENPRFFLTATGYTTVPGNAVNIKGRQGVEGPAGKAFIIDQQGNDRSIYDTQLKDFTFLNTATGKVSWKKSDNDGDWSNEYQWTGGGDVFTEDITVVLPAGKSFGKYVNGDVIPAAGKTAIQVILMAARAYIDATFTTFVITDQDQTVEVGETISGDKTVTWAINVGSGVVSSMDIVNVTDNIVLATNTANDGSQIVTVATKQLNTNGATYSFKGVLHDTGTEPKDTDSALWTITARYKIFYGPSSGTPADSAAVRALPSNAFRTGAGTKILNTGTSKTDFLFSVPSGVTITSVIDLDALNAVITSQYVLVDTVDVDDASGTDTPYDIYKMTVGAPYSSNHRHQITHT